MVPLPRVGRDRSITARPVLLEGQSRINSRECWPSPEAQLGSSRARLRNFGTNLRNQLVRVIRAPLGQLRVEAYDRCIVLDPEPPSVASRTDHHDARRRKRTTFCADLVALSWERVFHCSPPLSARVR